MVVTHFHRTESRPDPTTKPLINKYDLNIMHFLVSWKRGKNVVDLAKIYGQFIS